MPGQFVMILPEIMLTAVTLITQVLAVFYQSKSGIITRFSIIMLMGIIFYLIYYVPHEQIGFTGSFLVAPIIAIFKAMVLGFTVLTIILYQDAIKLSAAKDKTEFITLILLSTLGIFIAISAQDFILLFCGLELQAIVGYAIASFRTDNSKSSEAGLKYFILGALMSALMLLGISFLYGFSGSIRFAEISKALNGEFNIGLVVGGVLVLAGILFKLSAAPLHIWTPDVYEGAPISAVIYFSVVQKLGMLVVLVEFVDIVIGQYKQISVDLIKIVAVLSMITGALGAIRQLSLKRLMAYSTILNMGYVLIGVVLHSEAGKYAAFLYMLIYIIGVIGFFACLIALFGSNSDEATFEDLKGIASNRKTLAAVISIIMFSMIGLPPLAGFFGKYYVFYNAINQGEIMLSLIGVITSVVAAFYYLKVIKFMYFVNPDKEITAIPTSQGLLFVTTISLAFTLFFFILALPYIL